MSPQLLSSQICRLTHRELIGLDVVRDALVRPGIELERLVGLELVWYLLAKGEGQAFQIARLCSVLYNSTWLTASVL